MPSSSVDTLLHCFPKERPSLSPELQKIYALHYRRNRDGKTGASRLAQWAESWMHKTIAANAKDCLSTPPCRRATLEIGAGTLNQLPYEFPCENYDIVEPFKALYSDSPYLDRVRTCYDDISRIPGEARYDRILSIAAFEHLCDLPLAIALCGRLLNPGGVLQVAIPSEGGLLWTLGWRLTTGLEFRLQHGLDYGELIRHEHVNQAWEIETLLRHFFQKIEHRLFGLSKNWSLYQYFSCRQPDRISIDHYLNRHAEPAMPACVSTAEPDLDSTAMPR